MDPLDKLELIIKGTINMKKKERERGASKGEHKHSPLCIQGLDNQIDALSWVWTEIDAIRRNAPHVSEDIVQKMYDSEK